MKRDPALVPLSHDHHQALEKALQLRRVDASTRADVRKSVLDYWRAHGGRHFRIEEELLLPAFARHADPDQEAVMRVLLDHVWIRERMARLRTDELDAESMQELGERLDAHVRHEERVLFPMIEQVLPASELAELGRELELADN